ncbi:hypothetical protein [Legionella saoudiensis]|uniref:hypothetical protein n=1 Tax=Legionella saoudiensis TaxID=1750561 RepID=UPI000730BFAE|nr:hypothetical protein [Legionella saoudiensis]
MKKIMLITLSCVFTCFSQFASAETSELKILEAKMDQATIYLNKENTPMAWELTVEIANIIKKHPEYDDGEFAEGMIDIVSRLLTKPWSYASPYMTGDVSSALFRQFILNHINELSDPKDLQAIKTNVSQNCNQVKYPICKQLLIKVQESMSQ